MKYLVKEKLFSLRDRFTIKDEYGQDQFQVAGEFISLGTKLRIYDLSGNELLFISQELFHLLPHYQILRGTEMVARVKKPLSFFRPRLEITSPVGNYTVEGNFLGMEYSILREAKPVAWISKRWFSLSDTYGVEVDDQEDPAFILALVLLVDKAIVDPKRRK